MLTVLCFRWGTKYRDEYVARLAAGVKRHLSMPHRFLCVTNDPAPCETIPIDDVDLLSVRDGCYVRLRAFDPAWQAKHGIERLVWLDLDTVVTGSLDKLFDRPEPLVVLRGGHWNPCPMNGSVLMLKAGAHADVWERFNVEEAERISVVNGKWLGSDQTWIAHMAPKAEGWTYRDGVYSVFKPGWPGHLPSDARLVFFTGKKTDPATFGAPWVAKHWAA
jgi:hypothetical protein